MKPNPALPAPLGPQHKTRRRQPCEAQGQGSLTPRASGPVSDLGSSFYRLISLFLGLESMLSREVSYWSML